MNSMILSKVRAIVSADRKRFKDHEYDLDLSYILPNLIAMSYPAKGLEATWRNNVQDVCSLLKDRHNGKYMIWNLNDRLYDYNKFNNQIIDFPFPDHHAPNLNLLFEIVNSMDNWLKADPENVAVVSCKGGKGRTGTIICCYLYYSCAFPTMEKSMAHFAEKRSNLKKGVTQPSQQRYINYFKDIVSGNYMIDVISLNLQSIEIGPLTKEQANSISLEVYEHEKEANLSFSSSPSTLQITAINESANQYKLNVLIGKKLTKDILIRVFKGKKSKGQTSLKKQLFHLIFNVSFINVCNSRFVFQKKQLDHFKKNQKKFSDDFYIECVFQNNCTASPDHSMQIWNIMAIKYNQTQQLKMEQLEKERLETLKNVESLLDSNETSENDDDNSGGDNNTDGLSNSGATTLEIDKDQVEILDNNHQQQERENMTAKENDGDSFLDSSSSSTLVPPSAISSSTLSCTSTSNTNSSSNITVYSSTSSTSTTSITSTPLNSETNGHHSPPTSPINYRKSRMISVNDVKQMILSVDLNNINISGSNNSIYSYNNSMNGSNNSINLKSSTGSTTSNTSSTSLKSSTSIDSMLSNSGTRKAPQPLPKIPSTSSSQNHQNRPSSIGSIWKTPKSPHHRQHHHSVSQDSSIGRHNNNNNNNRRDNQISISTRHRQNSIFPQQKETKTVTVEDGSSSNNNNNNNSSSISSGNHSDSLPEV